MSTWTTVVAQPSNVTMNVRVDWAGMTTGDLHAVAEAVDTFAYTLCETCGYDVEDHIVTSDPFGNPFLYCEKGEED